MTRTKWKKEEFIDDDIVIAVDGRRAKKTLVTRKSYF